jgi:hypothetical protein
MAFRHLPDGYLRHSVSAAFAPSEAPDLKTSTIDAC